MQPASNVPRPRRTIQTAAIRRPSERSVIEVVRLAQWQDPLSRVPEAATLGVPTAAMKTGGTPEVVVNEETELLSATVDDLAADVTRLCGDAPLRSAWERPPEFAWNRCSGARPSSSGWKALYRELARSAQERRGQ